ncbi:hypothetical protein KDA_61770 [Dictyobacter alpinus]|uniref:Lipoprotein n=1 Tax=Dictyobacter alpinus TaxID=2014873 RepID=A0A402BH41_9CHLR|nr:hypothetical protein KDA_61770 [Dictyobacter alpinus]
MIVKQGGTAKVSLRALFALGGGGCFFVACMLIAESPPLKCWCYSIPFKRVNGVHE